MSATKYPRPTNALGQLEGYLLPRTLAEGIDRLATWCDQATILTLYQQIFPDAFAASTAPLTPAQGRAYSPRECECFALTEQHLFPFPAAWFCRLTERQDTFWLPSLGIDHENLSNLGMLLPGWQLIYVFMLIEEYGFGDEDLDLWLAEMDHGTRLAPLLKHGAEVGIALSRFLATCRTRPAPLCYLPEAYAVCAQATGNVFYELDDLETDDEERRSIPLRFTAECFQALAGEWREAEVIEAHNEEVTTWLAHPHHARMVTRLWAQHAVR
jgi:hypothetical protein